MDKHLIEKGLEWDTEETVPPHVWDVFAKANMLVPTLPAPLPVEWLKKLGVHDILGVVKVEEWDYIHTMIYADEVRPHLSGNVQMEKSAADKPRNRWRAPVSQVQAAVSRPEWPSACPPSSSTATSSSKSASSLNSSLAASEPA